MKLSKINILEALKIARSKIDSLDSELLLSFVKKVERSYLVTHEKEILTANEKKLFLKLVDERESKKPLAYLINQKGFWKNDFYVDSSVLIPRPETELLVEKILEHNLDGKDLLELGVGSGIISKSLNFLKNDGLLFLEHSPFQAKKIIKEAKKAGYSSCKQFKDYNGLLRISVLGL